MKRATINLLGLFVIMSLVISPRPARILPA